MVTFFVPLVVPLVEMDGVDRVDSDGTDLRALVEGH